MKKRALIILFTVALLLAMPARMALADGGQDGKNNDQTNVTVTVTSGGDVNGTVNANSGGNQNDNINLNAGGNLNVSVNGKKLATQQDISYNIGLSSSYSSNMFSYYQSQITNLTTTLTNLINQEQTDVGNNSSSITLDEQAITKLIDDLNNARGNLNALSTDYILLQNDLNSIGNTDQQGRDTLAADITKLASDVSTTEANLLNSIDALRVELNGDMSSLDAKHLQIETNQASQISSLLADHNELVKYFIITCAVLLVAIIVMAATLGVLRKRINIYLR